MTTRKLFFYLLLGALLFTGGLDNRDSFLLKTPHAPLRILSMELAPGNAAQASVLKDWSANHVYDPVYDKVTGVSRKPLYAIDVARQDTVYDFWFIAAYCCFLLFLLYGLKDRTIKKWNPLWLCITLVILTGACDVAENFYIIRSIDAWKIRPSETGIALYVFIPSVVKWTFTLLVISWLLIAGRFDLRLAGWLRRCSYFFGLVIKSAWQFRIVLIGQLLLYALLTLMNQGQDLLLTINSSRTAVILLITSVSVLAAINWYLPKFYENARRVGFNDLFDTELLYDTHQKLKLDLARLLGAITFLVPAAGILQAMQAYRISYLLDPIPPVVILLSLLLFYSAMLRQRWLDKIFKPNNVFSLPRYVWAMTLIALPVIIWAFPDQNRQPYYLAYLSLQLVLLSLAFLITVNYRTCMTAFRSVSATPFVLASGIFVSYIFLFFNIADFDYNVTKVNRFYTLPVVIAAVCFYTLLFSYLLIAGRRTGIRFITLLLLLTITLSAVCITDFHKVHEVAIKGAPAPPQTLDAYILKWLSSRHNEIANRGEGHAGGSYPVFFVNAYGGGIKAAAWTAIAVGALDSDVRANSSAGDDFQHYVLSYSGASGGTIGLSLLCAARLRDPGSHLFSDAGGISLFRQDYLTTDVTAIFGRDAWMSSFGLNLYDDRARLMEQGWEERTKPYKLAYDKAFHSAWSGKSTAIPLLMANTYDINTGWKGVVSPVSLNRRDFPGVVMVSDLINKGKDIPLSAAGFLSARFPYVSPTGKFDEQHHFTDGGTLENSGAETSLQVITVFKRIVDSLGLKDSVYRKIKINILSLPNSVIEMDSVERTKNLYELLAPGLGIIKSKDGNTIKADSVNRYRARQYGWNYFELRPIELYLENEQLWPVLPLGWQISDDALEMLRRSSRLETPERKRLLKQFAKP